MLQDRLHLNRNNISYGAQHAKIESFRRDQFMEYCLSAMELSVTALQIYHSTLKRRGNGHFHVVSMWDIRGLPVGWEALLYRLHQNFVVIF